MRNSGVSPRAKFPRSAKNARHPVWALAVAIQAVAAAVAAVALASRSWAAGTVVLAMFALTLAWCAARQRGSS
jgi:hypothetical protein